MAQGCRLIVSAFIVAAVFSGLLFIVQPAQAAPPPPRAGTPDTWTNCSPQPRCEPMLTQETNAGVVTASNGHIYVVGGAPAPRVFGAMLQEYDPSSNSWTARPDMPTPRTYLGAAATSNGKIYAIGGQTCMNCPIPFPGTVEEYDTTTNTWTNCGGTPAVTNCRPMPTGRTFLGVTTASNGKIYAVGGGVDCGGCGIIAVQTVEEYDPATNTWASRHSLPAPRALLGVVAASNGKVYAIGGYNDCSSGSCEVSTVDEYDPATDAWVSRSPMSIKRYDLGVAAIGRKIYAVGGAGGQSCPGCRFQTTEEYDTATDTWTLRADMPTGRSALGAAASGGKVYAIGGYDFSTIAVVEEYTPLPITAVCSPRPRIVVHTARGAAGELRVTLDAGSPPGAGDDLLTQIQFGNATNARITVPAGANGRPALTNSTGNTTLDLTERPASLSFSVFRGQAGQATTVPIVVTDLCGTWRTFVGGGPGAF